MEHECTLNAAFLKHHVEYIATGCRVVALLPEQSYARRVLVRLLNGKKLNELRTMLFMTDGMSTFDGLRIKKEFVKKIAEFDANKPDMDLFLWDLFMSLFPDFTLVAPNGLVEFASYVAPAAMVAKMSIRASFAILDMDSCLAFKTSGMTDTQPLGDDREMLWHTHYDNLLLALTTLRILLKYRLYPNNYTEYYMKLDERVKKALLTHELRALSQFAVEICYDQYAIEVRKKYISEEP